MTAAKRKESTPWLDTAKVAFCGAWLLRTWAAVEPASFETLVVGALPWVKLGGLFAGFGAAYWWMAHRPHRKRPTWEDWACGIYCTGLPGSGKTAWAYLQVREFCLNGWSWVWISIKSSLPLLRYLPAGAEERCILFAPYSDYPRGINLLRCYTGTATERELIADQAAELFERLHPHMSGNMRELIRMGSLALLQWADRNEVEVTLWELYRFFQEAGWRSRVLSGAPKPIRDAFSADEVRRQTLQAVRAQLRRSVTGENLLVALSQRDGVDLWAVMENERWVVCDTPESALGPEVAAFLCQVVASRLQILTSRRLPDSSPFLVACDEFQEYANPSFAKGIATGREFGLAWMLIHQSRSNQVIGKEVAGAVHLCGTRFYFQQAPEDAQAAVEATEGRWEKQVFTHLSKRCYKALQRLHGRPTVIEGVTPELPEPNPDVTAEIIKRSESGPSRAEILAEIRARKVVGRVELHGEGPASAAGTL